MEGDDDDLLLRPETLAALQGFIEDKQNQDERFLKAEQGHGEKLDMSVVQEDWQLSQFWYTDETAEALAKEAMIKAGPTGTIACLSCPTLYTKLRAMGCTNPAKVLEFDKRFAIHGDDFVYFDYKDPLAVQEVLAKGSVDVVIADPPFLSEECLRKTMQTIEYLARGPVILCTGYVMQTVAREHGLHPCVFHPAHGGGLANEFRCYTNYESEALGVDRHEDSPTPEP